MRNWLISVAIVMGACGDNGATGDDVDAAPPDGALVLRPGPCTAANQNRSCTYSYDDDGRPTTATCTDDQSLPEWGTLTRTWTFDGATLTGLHDVSSYFNSGSYNHTWTLDGAAPTRHEVSDDGGVYSWVEDEDYEVGVVLVGQLFDLDATPAAEDRRTHLHRVFSNLDDGSDDVTDVTYTYAPATVPTDGVRTRTGSDGASDAFEYVGGRLVAGPVHGYTWQDGRLTHVTGNPLGDVEYVYDAAGNLIERRRGAVVTTFDYACWE